MTLQLLLFLILALVAIASALGMLINRNAIYSALVTLELPSGFGSPAQVGTELFQNYLLPFEVTSVILLVAMIGAIVLTKNEKK
jgi:NADH-quinone oxidoreductase subunit J